MHPSSYAVLYAKIQSFPEEKQQALLQRLSDPHIASIRKHHVKDVFFSPEDFSFSAIRKTVHYSCF